MGNEVGVGRPHAAEKHGVVEELGEPTLLLPSLVGRGLDANGRAKYFLTLLQTARAHADDPAGPSSSLREERRSAGVDDPQLDRVVTGTRRVAPGRYVVPGARRIHRDLVTAIREMLAPLEATGLAHTCTTRRLEALLEDAPALEGDEIEGRYVDRITSARPAEGDSLHLLVMEAHRELNRLHASIATESIDGAAVFGLEPGDHELVAAFMAGVRETAPLKFDHPGLGTSATHVGPRLLIQNDLGTTEAHVVVLSVEDLRATLTYTDVHRRRLDFFLSLLEPFEVHWSGTQRRAATSLGEHHLRVGRFEAPDRSTLEQFLRHVGSRLVFVIDWNKARKRLTGILGPKDTLEALRWAADRDVGHVAFLSLGGERLIYDAVELSAKVPARYGEPLVEVFGREATVAIVQFALREAALGRLSGKSPLLIRDELRVEVLRHVHASHRQLLDAASEHASVIVECAKVFRAAVVRLGSPEGTEFLQRAVRRAAGLEHQADEILMAQRTAAHRVDGGATVTALTAAADDCIDHLEETVFLLTLVPDDSVAVIRPILDDVASVAVTAAREHLKAAEIARHVVSRADTEDLEDFLVAVDRVAALEHDADKADRMARAALVTQAPDFRSLYVADAVSRGAESSTDALLRSAFGLRDHILQVVAER